MPEINLDQEMKRIAEEIPEVDITMGLENGQGLKELIEQSDLGKGDQKRTEAFLGLAKNCKWIGTATELTYLMSHRSQAEKPREPYILGITNWLAATDSYGVLLKGENWVEAYEKFGIGRIDNGHTERFMQKITDSGKDIIFFVPPDLFTNKNGHVTRDEMLWLMSNQQKAMNVYLVFGGYNFINEEWHRKNVFNYTHDKRPKHLADAFQKWVNSLFAGTDK